MGESEGSIQFKAVLHEFIAMTLFVYIGCGVACTDTSKAVPTLDIAFAFGMAIMVLVYAIGHTSGGQLNWAVTIGLVTSGDLAIYQGCANALAQLLGAILGATLLMATLPEGKGSALGSNAVNRDNGYTAGAAFVAELIFSFMLVFVVLQTAIDEGAITGTNNAARPILAPVAIGFQIFLAHLFLIPITGCSINPPRSFGPAFVATLDGEKDMFKDFWIFLVAPCLGGVLAGLFHLSTKDRVVVEEVDEKRNPEDIQMTNEL